MSDAPPIPAVIWQRISAWLKAGGTGQITLDAHRGTVQQAWINERIRAQENLGEAGAVATRQD